MILDAVKTTLNPLFEPIEFDDTAELNIDDTAEITKNKSVVSKFLPEHS